MAKRWVRRDLERRRVPGTGIKEEVRSLIEEHIDSVYQLEVLLLVRSEGRTGWDAERVGRELRTDAASAGACLAELRARGLLVSVDASRPTYRYEPSRTELESAVALLADDYATRRVAVISLIYSKPHGKVKSFADAFRLRKEDKNG